MPVTEFLSPFVMGIGARVHPGVRDDPRQARLHLAFLASRLIGAGAALLAFPLYLALWGAPDLVTAVAFALLAAPAAIATYVSITGRLDAGQLLSSLGYAALLGFLAVASGASASALLPWMLLLPLEAVLTGSRRIALAAATLALAAMAAIAGANVGGFALAAELPLSGALVCAFAALPLLLNIAAVGIGTAPTPAAAGDIDCSYRHIAEDAPDLITRHRRNGNVTAATAAALRLLGAGPAELVGDGLFRRIHVADRPAFLKAVDEAAMGREGRVELRLQRTQPSGSSFVWFEMTCRMLSAAQEDREVVAVLRDVGERKAGESELAGAYEEVERASLAKSRFLARISHELRTPLNAVIGFSEILAQEMFGKLEQERHREYASMIHDSGRHLLDLINDILDMSKIESGTFEIFPEPFDLPALAETCRQMLDPQARKSGLTIETDLAAGLPELTADRRACKQILLNLLHNAVKFSHPGGRIVLGTYLEDGMACLYVADEGIGIARENLRRLGQPFVQVHSSYDCQYEGTGLGLSVVKGLAALHGGAMQIDSELGAGTRVTVRLPMASPGVSAVDACEPVEMRRLSA